MNKAKKRTKGLVLTAMLFALAIVLSMIEGMLPSIVPIPGVKCGLSNIVVMYALFFLQKQDAFFVTVLKGLFAAMTRGVMAGVLSTAGGLLSIFVMLAVKCLVKDQGTYFIYSISGALAHNIGQFIVISLLYTSIGVVYYLPVLIAAGTAAGMVTAILLNYSMPALDALGLEKGI